MALNKSKPVVTIEITYKVNDEIKKQVLTDVSDGYFFIEGLKLMEGIQYIKASTHSLLEWSDEDTTS